MNQAITIDGKTLDSKPISIWHYGLAQISDILFHGAVSEKTARGLIKIKTTE